MSNAKVEALIELELDQSQVEDMELVKRNLRRAVKDKFLSKNAKVTSLVLQDGYIKKGTQVCPVCGSSNISAQEHAQMDGRRGTQTIECLGCSSEWEDNLYLIDYTVTYQAI